MPRKVKQRIHREWFRPVLRKGRKKCTSCNTLLEAGETIWSWGEYRYAKFRHITDLCKACWPDVRVKLQNHAQECGCEFELVAMGAPRPDWLQLPECATV